MAYRTYINGNEWLGNNESDKDIFDELKRQGCKFDSDWCCKGFQVKDLDGLIHACEKRIIKQFNADNSIADFKNIFMLAGITNETDSCKIPGQLTWDLWRTTYYGYIYISAALLHYIGEDNYKIEYYLDEETDSLCMRYTLKEGAKCLFEAY